MTKGLPLHKPPIPETPNTFKKPFLDQLILNINQF